MRSPEQTIVDPAETDGPRVLAMGDAAVLVELADLDAVLAHAAAIEAAGWPGVVDVVPGARTVVVTVRPGTDLGALRRAIQTLDVTPIDAADGETVEIPVVYDGPDLAEVAELTGLDADEVVAAHTGTPWRVGFGGFAPGFAYLTGGDPRLNVERRSEPRTSVPPGAVGLAGEFSGIYPRSSPGGWQLIGRTDAPLWDATRTPPALLTPGAQVRFVARDAGSPRPSRQRGVPPSRGAHARATGRASTPPRWPSGRPRRWGWPSSRGARWRSSSVGPLALVQDLGRPGHAAVGVPRSGAADRAALCLANRLVANDDEGAAAIEVLLGGLAVRAHGLRTVALAGAPAPATVDGTPVAHHSVVTLRPGQTLALGPPPTGLRTYLAVRGGLAVDDVLGSVAGDTLSGLGPAPLQPGDVLAVGPEPEHPWLLDLAPVAPPTGGTSRSARSPAPAPTGSPTPPRSPAPPGRSPAAATASACASKASPCAAPTSASCPARAWSAARSRCRRAASRSSSSPTTPSPAATPWWPSSSTPTSTGRPRSAPASPSASEPWRPRDPERRPRPFPRRPRHPHLGLVRRLHAGQPDLRPARPAPGTSCSSPNATPSPARCST